MNKRDQPHGEPWNRAQDEADQVRDSEAERLQEQTEDLFGAILPREEPRQPRRQKKLSRRAR